MRLAMVVISAAVIFSLTISSAWSATCADYRTEKLVETGLGKGPSGSVIPLSGNGGAKITFRTVANYEGAPNSRQFLLRAGTYNPQTYISTFLAAFQSGVYRGSGTEGVSFNIDGPFSVSLVYGTYAAGYDDSTRKSTYYPLSVYMSCQLLSQQTSTALQSSPNPSKKGQAITLTATVSGTGEATGIVDFYEGATQWSSAALVNGVATINVVGLTAGEHNLVARYRGDDTHDPSDSAVLLHQVGVNTTTDLMSSRNISNEGEAVTFTATVSGGGQATGKVEFYEGSKLLGSANLSGGAAVLNLSNLTAGYHQITARYLGDDFYNPSSSYTFYQRVIKPTATSLQSTPNPSKVGQAVTFKATVADGDPAAQGTVYFYIGLKKVGYADVSNGVAEWTTSTLTAGEHQVKARYTGDNVRSGSESSMLVQRVGQETVTDLQSSLNPSKPGEAVTFTATVSGSDGVAGTVEFYDGSTLLGSADLASGVASLTTSALAAGTHSIVARYLGDATHYPSASDVLVQRVGQDSLNITTIQEQASGVAASTSAGVMTDITSEAITDALAGQIQVMSASDGAVGFTWAPGMVRGGTMITPTADMPGALTTDSPLRFWLKGRYTNWDGTLDGRQWNGLLGASVLFGDGMVTGLAAGYESYDYEATTGATLAGDGFSLGGYAGGKLGGGLSFDAQLHAAIIGYDVASGPVSGNFDARRVTAAAGVAYTLQQGAFTFTPTLRASGLMEWQDAYTDTGLTAHASRSFGNVKVSGGARLGYTVLLAEGGNFTPFVEVFGDGRFSDGDLTADSALDGLSGRIGAGFSLQTAGGSTLGASVDITGLGLDSHATSYQANLSIPF